MGIDKKLRVLYNHLERKTQKRRARFVSENLFRYIFIRSMYYDRNARRSFFGG